MNTARAKVLSGFLFALLLLGTLQWWQHHDRTRYLTGETQAFVALFKPPPSPDSEQTAKELAELLDLQKVRTPKEVEAAQDDRRTDIRRFYVALGFEPGADPPLPLLRALLESVEDDVRLYVRAAKDHFRRLRPTEIDRRIQPCIGDVRGDLSYPSGHATYGYVMVYLLRDMVPERESQLLARGDEFARQRMICGVHFRSDIEAGRLGARWLADAISASPGFRLDADAARAELRTALKLPPRTF